jgi:hypothetical protein
VKTFLASPTLPGKKTVGEACAKHAAKQLQSPPDQGGLRRISTLLQQTVRLFKQVLTGSYRFLEVCGAKSLVPKSFPPEKNRSPFALTLKIYGMILYS